MRHWLTVILILFVGILTSTAALSMPTAYQSNNCNVLLEQAADFVDPDDPDAFQQFGYITEGTANRIRSEPNLSGKVLGQVPALRIVEVLGEAKCAEGYLWREIAYNGIVGWTVETDGEEPFLVPYFAPQPESVGEHDEERGVIVVDTESAAFEIPYALFENPENVEVLMSLSPGDLEPAVMAPQPASLRFLIQEITEEDDGFDPFAPRPLSLVLYHMEDQCAMEPCIPFVSGDTVEVVEDQLPFGGGGAARGLTSQAAALDFVNGFGTRYLGLFLNGDLYLDETARFTFVYEGVTDDEVYGVSFKGQAIVNKPSLIPSEDFAAFWDDVHNDIEPTLSLRDLADQTENNLDNAAVSDFTPDLDLYAALIESLEVRQPDLTASAVAAN